MKSVTIASMPGAALIIAAMLSILAVWVALAAFRSNIPSHQSCSAGGHCSVSSVIGSDVYCVVDPVCLSPFYRDSDGAKTRWLGMLAYPDLLIAPTPSVTRVAIPNLVGFIALVSVCAMVGGKYVRRRSWRTVLCTTLIEWVVLEIIRWVAAS